MTVPTNYTASASGFKMPVDVRADYSATGTLSLKGCNGGKILVKLTNSDGKGCPSYLPLELTEYRERSVLTPWTFEWPVGIEITPRIGAEAGAEARLITGIRVSTTIPPASRHSRRMCPPRTR